MYQDEVAALKAALEPEAVRIARGWSSSDQLIALSTAISVKRIADYCTKQEAKVEGFVPKFPYDNTR